MQNKPSQIKIAVDAIVFGYSKQDGISVLLIQRKYDPFKNQLGPARWVCARK